MEAISNSNVNINGGQLIEFDANRHWRCYELEEMTIQAVPLLIHAIV
jgi:hypothetical protein